MTKESRLQEEVGIRAIPKNVKPVSRQGVVAFIQPFGEALANEVYVEAEKRIVADYPRHPWFQKNVCYRKADKDGIHGSSFDLNVIYNSILRESGLHLPSLLEGKFLDTQGALSNGVYREYGLQIASENDPNQDLSKNLLAEAKKRNWKFPLVVPSYNSLSHRKGDSGFEIYFLGDKENIDLEREVLQGDLAREFLLANFRKGWVGIKGVRRLCRGLGGWDARGDCRDSLGYGRVDFVSGEASAKNVSVVKEQELTREYDAKEKEYDHEMVQLHAQMDQCTEKKEALVSQRAAELAAFSEALKG